VLPFSVLEEVKDALVLHQARHEVEIGLVVLRYHVPFRVRAIETLRRGDAILAENLLQNVDDAQLLENPKMSAELQQP
jgi:hypothetical protein